MTSAERRALREKAELLDYLWRKDGARKGTEIHRQAYAAAVQWKQANEGRYVAPD